MVQPDFWIEEMARQGMIEPFAEGRKIPGTISAGPSAYGYDMRIADEFRVFHPSRPEATSGVIDPKDFDEGHFDTIKSDVCVVPPNSYVLARSLEYFRIPREVLAICSGKSTYARCGVIVNVTPLEPEWEGFVTISISNTAPLPVRLYAGEGIAQVIFIKGAAPCRTSYADKAGKYQGQRDITSPRTDG